MHEIKRHVLLPLQLFGLDFSITNEVVLLWTAALITFVLLTIACRRRGLVAHGIFQNMFEALIELIDKQVVYEAIGEEGRKWATFLITLFFFILFANLVGMIPDPKHFKAATSNINVTGGLALVVFAITIVISIRRHGPWGFVKKFRPEGVPWWLCPLIIPIHIITWIVKPFSLAIRLFANMVAGHMVILLFVGMATTAGLFLPIPIIAAVAMSALELFICFIQAFIFTMLSALYIREAMEAH